MADDAESALDRLYGVPLEEFVAERKAIAAELRASGRRDDAALVARATKPTVSAWAVNQVVRRNKPAVDALLAAGERLVAAQAEALGGSGVEAFDDAQRAERAAVRRLVDAATKILDVAGRSGGSAVRERIAGTLRAAAVDAEARELLANGRLTRDLEPAGFDPLAAMAAMARSRPRAKGKAAAKPKRAAGRARSAPAPKPDDHRGRLGEARQAVRAARERSRERDRAARDAERTAREAEQAADRARRAADDARRRAERARVSADEAAEDLRRAEAAVSAPR